MRRSRVNVLWQSKKRQYCIIYIKYCRNIYFVYLFICFLFKVYVNNLLPLYQYVKSVTNIALRKTNFMREGESTIENQRGEENKQAIAHVLRSWALCCCCCWWCTWLSSVRGWVLGGREGLGGTGLPALGVVVAAELRCSSDALLPPQSLVRIVFISLAP